MPSPPWLSQIEEALASGDEDALATGVVVLASIAGERVPLGDDERRAATRRALLLLTAGGDPTRGLDLNGRAVEALAEDLRDVDRQLALEAALAEIRGQAADLPHVSEALGALANAPDIAWRAFACALLAEELGADDET